MSATYNGDLVNAVWSIVQGNQYATINEYGKVTIEEGVEGQTIIIRATYGNMVAEAMATVSYDNQLVICSADTMIGTTGNVLAAYNGTAVAASWTTISASGGTMDSQGNITITGNGSITVQATYVNAVSQRVYTATKTITLIYEPGTSTETVIDPETGSTTTTTTTETVDPETGSTTTPKVPQRLMKMAPHQPRNQRLLKIPMVPPRPHPLQLIRMVPHQRRNPKRQPPTPRPVQSHPIQPQQIMMKMVTPPVPPRILRWRMLMVHLLLKQPIIMQKVTQPPRSIRKLILKVIIQHRILLIMKVVNPKLLDMKSIHQVLPKVRRHLMKMVLTRSSMDLMPPVVS